MKKEKNVHAAPQLGFMLKALMRQHGLSMRKLSELTGIQTATISRIVNGKQTAQIRHLQQFSTVFQVPMKELLEATGLEIESGSIQEGEQDSLINLIQDTLKHASLLDYDHIVPSIQLELDRYERYALTEEGHQLITNKFTSKAQQVDGMGPFIDQLMRMHKQYEDIHITEDERAILGSVLLYFILSTDVIPDYIFPIGYLDDAIAIKLGLNRLAKVGG
ncbi:DUF1232 domain-containing protein [Paenibacillus sp. NPDC058071]|uniref:DUF1232 domain-containing protein n=1 Tax=Paenibacillus sp. NPDC058071 TaxID=3346326 RepID=UPI0036D95132